jgi:hypothetical protein
LTELEEALFRQAFDALNPNKSGSSDEAHRAAKIRAKISDYLKYKEQRKPVAYMPVGIEDEILVPLPQYAGRNESEVFSRIQAYAIKTEGYRGTAQDRLSAIGLEIKGVYFD